jgi:hypothetical protein
LSSNEHRSIRSIDLSAIGALHAHLPRQDDPASWGNAQEDHWTRSPDPPGFSLGPLRTELGSTGDRHARVARVTLDGVTILGGSVGGSTDGRSARVLLSWPTSP